MREALLREGLLNNDAVSRLDKLSKETGEGLIRLLADDGSVIFADIAAFLKKHYGIDAFTRDDSLFDETVLHLISPDIALKHHVIPVSIIDNKLVAAFADPLNVRAHEDLEILLGQPVTPLFGRTQDIKYYIDKFYGRKLQHDIKANTKDSHAVRLLDFIIETATIRKASDIHIEPFEHIVRVRFRIDGLLTDFETVSPDLLPTLISRLKILSGMDISERRLPQDGHFTRTLSSFKTDFRVSTILTIHGEKAVIRLIHEENGMFDKNSLGFFDEDLAILSRLFKSVHGTILLTGPTGSGKTTTLAALVRELNKDHLNIVTIEDPVENVIYGVNQININPKAGLNFANALRSILRQDPDVIMVGEIRDEETAYLAIRSAITGHLVLATLHTNDAISAIFRLIDMGVPDYLVFSALNGVVSQRLVRSVCPVCKVRVPISDEDAHILNLPSDTHVFIGRGCPQCGGSGYKGRFAVYEIIVMDTSLKRLLWQKPSVEAIEAYLSKTGFKSLRDCTLNNVLLGNTTVSELYNTVLI